MAEPDDTSLCNWLARFQHLEMTEAQVAQPAGTVAAFAGAIRDTAKGMAFDTDPAAFNKLLHDLAPDDLRSGDLKSGDPG